VEVPDVTETLNMRAVKVTVVVVVGGSVVVALLIEGLKDDPHG
jgi:hypothetical protein